MQKILVCDDDKQIVEAIDIYLTGEGFQVIKAYDGLEALELLKTNEVNLMIVDGPVWTASGPPSRSVKPAAYRSSFCLPSQKIPTRFWD